MTNKKKLAQTAVAGVWLAEISKTSTSNHSHIESVNNFISGQIDRYLPRYKRDIIEQPRGCVIVVTVNFNRFLVETRDNRRYWPVLATRFDVDGIVAGRDQLFAEAVALYRANFQYWPTPAFEAEHIRPRQKPFLRF